MKKRSEATQTLRAGCSIRRTHTQTDRGDYNALRSLARSVITNNIILGYQLDRSFCLLHRST